MDNVTSETLAPDNPARDTRPWWITTNLEGGQIACKTDGGINRARECIQQYMESRFESWDFSLRMAPQDVTHWINDTAFGKTHVDGGWMMERRIGGVRELNGACAVGLLFVPVRMTENITLLVDDPDETGGVPNSN